MDESGPGDERKPGRGFFGWLGRQVGYVTKAVKTDVTGPQVVYRKGTVQEAAHPDDPKVKLRRTIIDEVITAEPGRVAPEFSKSAETGPTRPGSVKEP